MCALYAEQFNMSAVSYRQLLLTHVSAAAQSYPHYKLSTVRETDIENVSVGTYFQFSGHCFAVVSSPSTLKTFHLFRPGFWRSWQKVAVFSTSVQTMAKLRLVPANV